MICAFCDQPVAGKKDLQQRAEYRSVQPGFRTSPLLFADGLPEADGPLSAAWGPLWEVLHRKCYLARRRHQQLQDARDADASAQSREPADWREPVSAEVEDMRSGEGNGDNRGA